MTNSKPTQCQRIIDYMTKFGTITQYQAIRDLGVMRLASRVTELRKAGYVIHDRMVPVKNRFGEKCHIKQYRLGGTEHE